jgi:hypothetical protein
MSRRAAFGMVYNLGYQHCPATVCCRDFEREGADTNVATHGVSVVVTCDLK